MLISEKVLRKYIQRILLNERGAVMLGQKYKDEQLDFIKGMNLNAYLVTHPIENSREEFETYENLINSEVLNGVEPSGLEKGLFIVFDKTKENLINIFKEVSKSDQSLTTKENIDQIAISTNNIDEMFNDSFPIFIKSAQYESPDTDTLGAFKNIRSQTKEEFIDNISWLVHDIFHSFDVRIEDKLKTKYIYSPSKEGEFLRISKKIGQISISGILSSLAIPASLDNAYYEGDEINSLITYALWNTKEDFANLIESEEFTKRIYNMQFLKSEEEVYRLASNKSEHEEVTSEDIEIFNNEVKNILRNLYDDIHIEVSNLLKNFDNKIIYCTFLV